MGKPRLKGQHTKIFVRDAKGNNILVGEVSKFSVKELGELKKSRSLGEAGVTGSKTFEGYDLSFEGGKVDWRLSQLLHTQDVKIYNGERSPYFQVETTFKYFGGDFDTYFYPEVTFFGYNLDADANDEAMEKWEGFCGELRTHVPNGSRIVASDPSTRIAEMITDALNNKDGVVSDAAAGQTFGI